MLQEPELLLVARITLFPPYDETKTTEESDSAQIPHKVKFEFPTVPLGVFTNFVTSGPFVFQFESPKKYSKETSLFASTERLKKIPTESPFDKLAAEPNKDASPVFRLVPNLNPPSITVKVCVATSPKPSADSALTATE